VAGAALAPQVGDWLDGLQGAQHGAALEPLEAWWCTTSWVSLPHSFRVASFRACVQVDALWRHRYPEDYSYAERQSLLESQMRLLGAGAALTNTAVGTAGSTLAERYGAQAVQHQRGAGGTAGGAAGSSAASTHTATHGLLQPTEAAVLSRLVRHRLPTRSPLPRRPIVLAHHVLNKGDVVARVAALRDVADAALDQARTEMPSLTIDQLLENQATAAARLPHKTRVALQEVCRAA